MLKLFVAPPKLFVASYKQLKCKNSQRTGSRRIGCRRTGHNPLGDGEENQRGGGTSGQRGVRAAWGCSVLSQASRSGRSGPGESAEGGCSVRRLNHLWLNSATCREPGMWSLQSTPAMAHDGSRCCLLLRRCGSCARRTGDQVVQDQTGYGVVVGLTKVW